MPRPNPPPAVAPRVVRPIIPGPALIGLGLALLAGGCGGVRQAEVDEGLTRIERELRGLRDAYEAQSRRLESVQDRLALVEDQLEARALHGGAAFGEPGMAAGMTAGMIAGMTAGMTGDGMDGSRMTAPGMTAPTPTDRAPVPGRLPVVRLSPQAAPPAAPAEAPPPMPAEPELPPSTITQADIDALDGGPRPAPRARRRARRPVPPPANAAFAGNIGVSRLAPQPDFDGAAPRPAAVEAAPADGPIGAFKAAEALYRAGDLTAAIQAFEAFVAAHPRHGYADNALYLAGRCRYARAEYARALAVFRRVLTTYPTGNQVPDALLMIGLTQARLGRGAEGRETLARLQAMYPDTAAARQAAAELDRPQGQM